MTFFHPLAGSMLQSDQVQRQAVNKQRQIRRSQDLQKNSAPSSEEPDHQVESPDAVVDINPDGRSREEAQKRRKPPQPVKDDSNDPNEGLDLTA